MSNFSDELYIKMKRLFPNKEDYNYFKVLYWKIFYYFKTFGFANTLTIIFVYILGLIFGWYLVK